MSTRNGASSVTTSTTERSECQPSRSRSGESTRTIVSPGRPVPADREVGERHRVQVVVAAVVDVEVGQLVVVRGRNAARSAVVGTPLARQVLHPGDRRLAISVMLLVLAHHPPRPAADAVVDMS